jgi:NAD(P)H-flavin reductase
MSNPHMPGQAIVLENIQESSTLYTLRLQMAEQQEEFRFMPGQFNMLYLPGVGEIPISIVSDPRDEDVIDHTIRKVGRVTNAMASLKPGDRIGLRGPYGRGWPIEEAKGKDIVIVTGGLGCAPVVSMIHYVSKRRERFGHLNIVQGVKHSSDLIWRERYEEWRAQKNTTVLLASDAAEPVWPFHVGRVTDLFDQLEYREGNVCVMMCGPEGMMIATARQLQSMGVESGEMWLSMERNMQCALGQCGHCQFGSRFVCKDGPVFRYSEIDSLLGTRGF